MKNTFEDVREIKLEDSDRTALASLSHNRAWGKFKAVVEDYVLKLTHNLAVGNVVSKDARYEEMDRLAGFVYYWTKLKDLVENGEHHKKDEKTE